MGKKKGKNTQQQKQEEERGEVALDNLPDSEGIAADRQPKGKKGKKKKRADEEDDIEDELMEIAQEQGLEGPKLKENVSPAVTATVEVFESKEEKKEPEGKKGKKKKKQKDDDWEDDIAQEIERMSLGADSSSVKTDKQELSHDQNTAREPDTKTTRSEDVVVSHSTAGNEAMKEEEKGSSIHVKSKAEKKTAKKGSQKEMKKQPEQKQEEEEHQSTVQQMVGVAEEQSTVEQLVGVVEGGDQDVEKEVDEGEGDEDDAKKKKKKKKKKSGDDEKKSSKPKKVKAGILKMKEEIEALRAAQKKREEEELARQRKAEEEERQRLEKLRLEKERKEKKKQKEKERRERLKKEGKLLSKAEKEKRAKQAVQIAALMEMGVVVPQLKSGGSEGERKPVRYGSRVRHRKNKPVEKEGAESGVELEMGLESASTMEDSEMLSEVTTATLEEEEQEAGVKDNWDDLSEEEDDVKDNWDDEESDKEEDEGTGSVSELATPDATTPSLPDIKGRSAHETGEDGQEEESGSDTDSGESSSEEDEDEEVSPYDRAARRIQERRERHAGERTPDLLRSPVVCVLGHVDTGKTKILDKIRHTNVQDGEAGGITQQIGATFVPEEAIKEQTKCLKEFSKSELRVPGLLIIDTPGHESFSNLRTRGSSMCDIAILVVDIMHGLEPQTIESLQLLRKGNVPFIVALNKIDRLFDWRRSPSSGVRDTLKRQKQNTRDEFDERVRETVTQFAERGLNSALFWEKVDFTDYIPLVPTSAISGDGMADLIAQIVTHSEKFLVEKLMFSKEVEAMVLEVKVIGGLGTTIDIILRNGILSEGDSLVLMGSEGPFVTQSRALLMPQPLRELRVKNAYVNHKTVIASQGVKICGKDLEKAMAGTPVLVAKKDDEIDVLKDEAAKQMSGVLSTIKLKEKGVFVQASTLGSLEALLEFLKTSKIPYAGVNIGPVHKKDVMKASTMLEKDSQWACILAFDVRVERDAQEMADSVGVRIFTADIIYHLFDSFMKHRQELKEKRRRENEHIAIFPCKLRIIPNCVFNARNPIVVGVSVEAGILKPGTPLCVPSREFIHIGTVTSLEINHKTVEIAHKGEEVCIKIESTSGDAPKLYGRHFDLEDLLVSKISRESIDAVKSFFREDLQKSDWQLIIELKKLFQIY